MKRLLMVVLLVGGGLAGGSYLMTGRWPWVALSPEEQEVAALRDTLGRIRQQWREAGKTQALGVDASSLSDDIPSRLDRLDQEVVALLPRLRTTEAREQAVLLRRDIATARAELK
jgi:hypothetical protein